MSPLIEFYAGAGADHRGRTLPEIQAWPDSQIERVHDYIQWLFPLPEPSGFNQAAPILSPRDIEAFRKNVNLQDNLLKSFRLMLRFYGFRLENTDPPAVVLSSDHAKRAANWLTQGNHNFLRITRILKCLTILGLQAHATAFLSCLHNVYAEDAGSIIGPVTLRYWDSAVPDDNS